MAVDRLLCLRDKVRRTSAVDRVRVLLRHEPPVRTDVVPSGRQRCAKEAADHWLQQRIPLYLRVAVLSAINLSQPWSQTGADVGREQGVHARMCRTEADRNAWFQQLPPRGPC